MDLTVVAYATLALSLFVSAVKMGGWILNADPRAIINSGRWALLALAALALGVLAWLVASGRWTSAMMLAAFMLPVFVQAAPRWLVLFGRVYSPRSDFPPNMRDFCGAARDVATPARSLAADPLGGAERRPPPAARDLPRPRRDARRRHRLRELRCRLGAAGRHGAQLLAHGRGSPRRAAHNVGEHHREPAPRAAHRRD